MKFTIPVEVAKPREFHPVTVALTFETSEELLRWCNMLGYNMSIPELVLPNDKQKQAYLMGEMTNLRLEIQKASSLVNK